MLATGLHLSGHSICHAKKTLRIICPQDESTVQLAVFLYTVEVHEKYVLTQCNTHSTLHIQYSGRVKESLLRFAAQKGGQEIPFVSRQGCLKVFFLMKIANEILKQDVKPYD